MQIQHDELAAVPGAPVPRVRGQAATRPWHLPALRLASRRRRGETSHRAWALVFEKVRFVKTVRATIQNTVLRILTPGARLLTS